MSRVKVDFDAKYAVEEDPWGIADARTPRYELYRERLLAWAGDHSRILDIGSGFGAFLARFEDEFDALDAVELAAAAVAEGARRHPGIRFMQGSAAALEATQADGERYGAVICSDVLYYLPMRQRRDCLAWIARHLTADGVALLAAYCPGGRYMTPDGFRELIGERFVVLEDQELESEHVALVVRARRARVALTIDHETWQPIPEGRHIDWDADVFAPTTKLLEVCDRHGAKLTLFTEVGEYLWLTENDPAVAERFAAQWRDAIGRGHDVQLHLHPNWLPELGARRVGDTWAWDASVSRANDYPGDLTELIGRCVRALEDAIRPAHPDYKVTCFRAGTYEAQPFTRIHDALAANGIICDSSVYAGGHFGDRTYDYRLAYSDHQPYFASRHDPQLKAPPAEREIVEQPIFAPKPNERWTFDYTAGPGFETALLERLDAAPDPRRERLVRDDHYVLIGHSKADLDLAAIDAGLSRIAERVGFATMTELATDAREQLEQPPPAPAVAEPAASPRLVAAVPRDRHRVLNLGAPAPALAERLPWAAIVEGEVDADTGFDLVYADHILDRAHDVDATLRGVHRALGDGGLLVAAIASAARTGDRVRAEAWRTGPDEVGTRLLQAGFTDVRITEARAPYRERAMVVRAWRRDQPVTALDRARELTRFVYEQLDPELPAYSTDLGELLAGGTAWCTAYAVAAGLLLREEGYGVRWSTMIGTDTHEVIEVELPDGSRRVVDAMANVWFEDDLQTLLSDPARADVPRETDARYHERGYGAYTCRAWYETVNTVAVRVDPDDPPVFDPAAYVARTGGNPRSRVERLARRVRAKVQSR